MSRYIPLLIVLLFLPSISWSVEKEVIEGVDNQISYSVGHQVGRDLVRQGVKLNNDLAMQGIIDATSGKEPLMTFEAMIDTLAAFRERIIVQSKTQGMALRQKGVKFLAENAKKEGVVTLPSGLQYKVLKAGGGKKPLATDMVTVSYVSRDINGQIFDKTFRDGKETPVQFKVENVIPGWLEALQLMPEGSKWELSVPYQLGYKDKGPLAGQTTLFVIDLVKVGE